MPMGTEKKKEFKGFIPGFRPAAPPEDVDIKPIEKPIPPLPPSETRIETEKKAPVVFEVPRTSFFHPFK